MRPRFAVAAALAATTALGYGFVSTRSRPVPHRSVPSVTANVARLDAMNDRGGAVNDRGGTAKDSGGARQPNMGVAAAPSHNAAAPTAAAVPTALASMPELRALLASDPEQALARARASSTASPNDADAPERGFIVVRALDELHRHHEAQAEARALVQRYPGNRFAEDVERHVLVYPLDQPSREAQQAEAARAARASHD